ncbi:uncharacterized protein LOC122316410 [Carya illinoinensis]|uniref:uncharacterized protein LOC122316410 n=1 Tax=Carya illinoinensis TaxID=32201 RepID=UPI001C71BF77|nr:uncharacterized protein LOC122316410 [Carya illinoinensis]
MLFRRLVEVEPPSLVRDIIGAAIMMIGVVLPVGYMMFRNKRVSSSSSSYSKQTKKDLYRETENESFGFDLHIVMYEEENRGKRI